MERRRTFTKQFPTESFVDFLLRCISVKSVNYCFFQLLRIPDDLQIQTPGKRLLAGALAGVTSVSATYPLDLVRFVGDVGQVLLGLFRNENTQN